MRWAARLPWLVLCRGRRLLASSAAAAPDTAGRRRLPADGPGLAAFLTGTAAPSDPASELAAPSDPASGLPAPSDAASELAAPSDPAADLPAPSGPVSELPAPRGVSVLEHGLGRRVLFVVHGCQMNVSDTEVAWAVLRKAGYQRTGDISQADVVLIMTCSIREGAETKIWNKLENYKRLKASKGYTGTQFKVRPREWMLFVPTDI